MRILYCASEANPFCGSGGLADVAGSLPHTLCKKGQDWQNWLFRFTAQFRRNLKTP